MRNCGIDYYEDRDADSKLAWKQAQEEEREEDLNEGIYEEEPIKPFLRHAREELERDTRWFY